MFLSRWQQSPKSQPKLVVDESIPALFTPAATPEPSEFAVDGQQPLAVALTANDPSPKAPDTELKIRYTSPTEVVRRATALEGVAGALVVLPEGLLVASNFSLPQNPDALAAFLARALGKVVECAEEARIGELSRLQFWADNVPWLIFRLDGVLLASFGQPGGSLPAEELAAMAVELEYTSRG
jgi:predicted regulator of Ras-like GTPase activity (Roadblock/LC7/MglB family)